MTIRSVRSMSVALAITCAGGVASGRGEAGVVITDPAGDASIRRTDPGNDGPLVVGATLPDIIEISIAAWSPTNPAADPYTGNKTEGNGADIFRLDVVFSGLVNPPGPLGLGGSPYDPFEHGNNPVFGFVEIDVDDDRDTGGELGTGAWLRYLAVVARYATMPKGSISARVAISGADLDTDFSTAPQIERSGQDFALNLCGCFVATVVDRFGDTDTTFDAGDTWIVNGRFFQRAGGYEEASAAFGGSGFGLYDPFVDLLFAHDIGSDRTTVTLVYPLTMAGAAALAGEPEQPIDLDVGNHTAVVEALDDIIIGAEGPLFGPVRTLTEEWEGRDPTKFLRPEDWSATALVGMSYTQIGPVLYAWTDVVGKHRFTDFDADNFVTTVDRDLLVGYISATDGGPDDDDGQVDGAVAIPDFGPNFVLFDVDGDGIIDQADELLVVPDCLGDADGNHQTDVNDITFIVLRLGQGEGSPADVDRNEAVDVNDITFTVLHLGDVCP